MNKIFLIILVLVSLVLGVSYNSSGSGTFDVIFPLATNNDDCVVLNGHIVTLTSNDTINKLTIEGTFILNDTLVMGGDLIVGNGSSKDGTLTFGPNSQINSNSYIRTNNCRLNSTTDANNWATVVGSCGIDIGTSYTAPKMDCYLRYVSFQNTGAIYFKDGGSSGGALWNRVHLSHCVFAGCSKVEVGLAGWTPYHDTAMVDSSDFPHLTLTQGQFSFRGTSGDAYGYSRIRHCTFNQMGASDPYGDIFIAGKNRTYISYCVFANCGYSVGDALVSTAGPVYHDYNFYTRKSTSPQSDDVLLINEPRTQSTHMANCYVYTDHSNSHPVSFVGNTGTFDTVANCIFEVYTSGSSGSNTISVGNGTLLVRNNISTGEAALVNNVRTQTGDGVFIINNTILNKFHVTTEDGIAWLTETGVYTGDIIAYNNSIMSYRLEPCGFSAVSGLTQGFKWIGHNTFEPESLTSRCCRYTVAEDSSATNVSYGHCPIRDSTRTLWNWCVSIGGQRSFTDAVDTLLRINGYNASTKTQGCPTRNNILRLNGYVKSRTYQTAGYGQGLNKSDFGAIPQILTHKDTVSNTSKDTLYSIDSVSADLYLTDYKRSNLDSVYIVTDTVKTGTNNWGRYIIKGPIRGGEKCTTKIAKKSPEYSFRTYYTGTIALGDSIFTDTLSTISYTYTPPSNNKSWLQRLCNCIGIGL